MEWILFSLLVPIFGAWNNVVDQVLVRRYFPENGLTALVLGSLTYIAVLPFIALFFPAVFVIEAASAFYLFLLGLASPLIWFPYFWCLERDDASVAMPTLQTMPIWVFILGFVFLREVPTAMNLIGAAMIILASMAMTADFSKRNIRLKTFMMMLLCAVLFAVQTYFFRLIAINLEPLIASFWVAVGFGAFGAIAFFGLKRFRAPAFASIRQTKGAILIPTAGQEISYFLSIIFTILAMETAPVAGLVPTLFGFQPFFVILFSLLACRWFKDCFEQTKIDRFFYFQLVCLAFMIAGLYLFFV